MENTYWEKEEFEDLVVRSIIGLYESRIKKHRGSHKSCRFDLEKLNRMRQLGCYFSPDDRVMILDREENEWGTCSRIQTIDINNDGRPNLAALSYKPDFITDENSMSKDAFLENCYLERILKLPNGVHCDVEGRKYRIIQTWHRNNFIEGHCLYVVINSKGEIHPTHRFRPNYDPVTKRCPIEKVCAETCQSEEESKKAIAIETVIASMIIQFYQDRRNLWNVTAKEEKIKSTFSVYPEQVKSLFYARDLPITETGRKKPILHWVSAHQRRIKSGIDIDIDKYLRGTTVFEYKGTQFTIINPIKNEKTNEK